MVTLPLMVGAGRAAATAVLAPLAAECGAALVAQWRPASAHESFEIVRRRLFQEPDADARRDIAAVARAFVEFYGQAPRRVPP